MKTQVTDEMVSRFLAWRLPQHFYPDCHIAFDREKASQAVHSWPTGTNLLNAEQARAMLAHVMEAAPQTLQPHQQRVVDEKRDLDEKRQKLQDFYSTPIFHGLPESEQSRLFLQGRAMRTYSEILGERIAAF